jgi:peptide/nickel transport system substrate-binding protein
VPYIWRNQALSQVVYRDVVSGYYPNPMTFDGTGTYYYDLTKTGVDPTFTELLFGEPDSLDPAFDYETAGGQVIQNVAETLIWYNGASASQFKPMLALTVPDPTNPADVTADGLTWNFTLRPAVTFHSGNAVNCAAVEFSIERALVINDPDGPAWILDQSLTDYAADDPGTPLVDERLGTIQGSVTCPLGGLGLAVQFHLAKPYPAFLATLAYTVASVIDPDPASYTVSSRCADPADMYNTTCDDQLVSTGPFSLRVWTPGTQVILDRYTNYWRAPAQIAVADIQKVDDVATRVLRLKAGDADAIALSPDHDVDIRDASGNLLPGILEYKNPTFVVQFLGLNQNINVTGAPAGDSDVPATFFADVNVRKAFAHAWNYDGFIQDVLLGYGTVLCGPVPEGMFGYDPTVPCFNQDLDKVRQYLENATDTRPGHTGSYWDNGFTLTLYYNEGNLPREEGARQLKTTLEGLNSQRTGTRSGNGEGTRSGSPPISISIQPLIGALAIFMARSPISATRTATRGRPSIPDGRSRDEAGTSTPSSETRRKT